MTMALSTELSLEELVGQFRGLNLNEPETWQLAPRILFMILAAVLVVVLGWQFYWSGKLDERDAKRMWVMARWMAFSSTSMTIGLRPAISAAVTRSVTRSATVAITRTPMPPSVSDGPITT